MTGPWRRMLLPALVALAAVGCSSAPETDAGQAIEQFYRNLNDGDYKDAISLYNAEARKVLADPDTASDSAFAEWAKLETKNGTFDRVDVVEQAETGEAGATVQYRVVYRDGSSVVRTVTLTREDGQWKLGLIG